MRWEFPYIIVLRAILKFSIICEHSVIRCLPILHGTLKFKNLQILVKAIKQDVFF